MFSQSRSQIEKRYNVFGSLRMTHVIDASTYYEITASYQSRIYKNLDPDFGTNWARTWTARRTHRSGTRVSPAGGSDRLATSVINGFALNNEIHPEQHVSDQQAAGMGCLRLT